MTIGIDTSRVTKPHLTGTEYYSIELIKAFSRIDTVNHYLLYAKNDPMPRLGKLPTNFSEKIMPFPRLWSQVRLSWEMLFRKPDVLFVPAHLLPLIHPKNSVVTLHDLGFKHFPELYSPKELIYHNWGMKFSALRSCKIITDSEYSKKDLIKTYSLEPSKIDVVYLGCDLNKFKPGNGPKKPYIFYIGRLEEKKNVAGMIRAYGILRKEAKIKHKFILAGKPGFGYEKIAQEINYLAPEIRKDVIQLGYISDEDYIKRLQEADIFFFCGFFEGFGLPIIEAMACGTPVVTSNTTSMPEVSGNAAILVNPRNPLEMAGALSRLINSDKLKESLIFRGRNHARKFTWEKTAQQTLRILEEVSQSN